MTIREIAGLDPKLPRPVAFKLLCEVPRFEEMDETSKRAKAAGIVLASESNRKEEAATVVYKVLAMGPDAYSDAAKFPSGAWCNPGDFIITRSYSGTRVRMKDSETEYRFLDDTAVEAITTAPEQVGRA